MRGRFFCSCAPLAQCRKKSPHTRHTLAFYTRNIQLNELSEPLNLVYAQLIAYLKRYGVRIFFEPHRASGGRDKKGGRIPLKSIVTDISGLSVFRGALMHVFVAPVSISAGNNESILISILSSRCPSLLFTITSTRHCKARPFLLEDMLFSKEGIARIVSQIYFFIRYLMHGKDIIFIRYPTRFTSIIS